MGALSKLAQAQLCRYCAIKLTKDYMVNLDDKNDPCYAATLLEWTTYKALHNPKHPQPAASKGIRPEDRKRKAGSQNSSHDITGHEAGQVDSKIHSDSGSFSSMASLLVSS